MVTWLFVLTGDFFVRRTNARSSVAIFFLTPSQNYPPLSLRLAAMPRSEERRVQALLNGAWNRREVRTASHTSVVIEAQAVGARRAGRPRDSIVLMNDGEHTTAGRIVFTSA